MAELWNTLLSFKECVELWADKHQALAAILSFVLFVSLLSLSLALFIYILLRIQLKLGWLSEKDVEEILSRGIGRFGGGPWL